MLVTALIEHIFVLVLRFCFFLGYQTLPIYFFLNFLLNKF